MVNNQHVLHTNLFDLAIKSSFLIKDSQTVDYKCFRESTFVSEVFQGRTKTNGHVFNCSSKSTYLSQVNKTGDYKCFQKSTLVFLVIQGRKQTHGHFSKNNCQIKIVVKSYPSCWLQALPKIRFCFSSFPRPDKHKWCWSFVHLHINALQFTTLYHRLGKVTIR